MLRFPLAILRPAPISTRLWQGGGIVAAVVLTIVAVNFFLPKEEAVGRKMLGHDFLAFYTAGTLVRDGRAELLYDLKTSEATQRAIGAQFDLELGKGFGPFWNPPFYAWVFAPLAALPYETAAAVWVCFNVACAVIAIALLARMISSSLNRWDRFAAVKSRRYWMLVPVLVCVSMPFLQAISHAQNTCVSLLLLTIVALKWRQRRAIAAGICCGLLFYKPQLAAVVAAMLTITLGWRAFLGLAATGTVLLAITAFTLPGSLELYLSQLPLNLAAMQIDAPYLWERHVTLKAFWRLLFQGPAAGELSLVAAVAWIGTSIALAAGLLLAAWNLRSPRTAADDPFATVSRAGRLDRLIAATIVTMPLLMPFYFDYDLLLLAIPVTLFAVERLRRPDETTGSRDRTLVKIAAMLYVWLMINPGIARMGGVNASVVLLAATAALFIERALRDDAATAVTIRTTGNDKAGDFATKTLRFPPAPRPMAA